MSVKSLAVKYRPLDFEDVTEQTSTIEILKNQLKTGTQKNCYLFCGGAGTGKTTCARIFANNINKGQGNPLELDAASNNSVNDVRDIIDQAQTKSLNSEYKVFIIDECHALSNSAWQAFLKLIEEPPMKSVFIFCTTDPQKIPKTIISRVQRFNFQRISTKGIVERLNYICEKENIDIDDVSIKYIARQADGGMRDAITLLDKCASFSTSLNLDKIVDIIGVVPYKIYMDLTVAMLENNNADIVMTIENVYSSGKDMRTFIFDYLSFILDICKYISAGKDFSVTMLPDVKEIKDFIEDQALPSLDGIYNLLNMLISLDSKIKFNTNPKTYIEAIFLTQHIY